MVKAIALAPAAIAAMRQAPTVVQEVLSQSEPVYDLTTGVGEGPLNPAVGAGQVPG